MQHANESERLLVIITMERESSRSRAMLATIGHIINNEHFGEGSTEAPGRYPAIQTIVSRHFSFLKRSWEFQI